MAQQSRFFTSLKFGACAFCLREILELKEILPAAASPVPDEEIRPAAAPCIAFNLRLQEAVIAVHGGVIEDNLQAALAEA